MLKGAFVCIALSVSSFANAGIIGYLEEINSGSDLRLTIEGYLNTATLGAFSTQTNTDTLLYAQANWAYLTNDTIDDGLANHFSTPVNSTSTGGGLTSLIIFGGTIISGGEYYFGANDGSNFVWVNEDYVSGTIVKHIVEYSGSNFTTESITLGDSVTKSWNGGGAGNFISIIAASPSAVPEPSTLAIFALGMIGLASRRFKKQS